MSRTLATGAAVALLFGHVAYNASGFQRRIWDQLQQSAANRARPLAEWVVAEAPEDATLVTDDDALLYLYTGRRTVPNGTFTPQEYLKPQTSAFAAESLREILRVYRADYVLASSEYALYAVHGLVAATPPELEIVKPLSTGAVFVPVASHVP